MALGTLGIIVYCEMAGRVAAVARQPVFNLIRERAGLNVGPRHARSPRMPSTLLTCAAEIGGVALVLQLLLAAAVSRAGRGRALVLLVVAMWVLPFKLDRARVRPRRAMLMIVFAVACRARGIDWGERRARARAARSGDRGGHGSCMLYCVLRRRAAELGAAAVRDVLLRVRRDRGSMEAGGRPLNRVIVIVGFVLGSAARRRADVDRRDVVRAASHRRAVAGHRRARAGGDVRQGRPAADARRHVVRVRRRRDRDGLSGAYNIAQFFGWPWGRFRAPPRRRASRSRGSSITVLRPR